MATLPRHPGDVFYLHGFASSSKSTKANYFAERLRGRGVSTHCPDFNEPDFASLTMTRMLEQLTRLIVMPDPGTQNPDHEPGTLNQNHEPGTRNENHEPGARNQEPGMPDREPATLIGSSLGGALAILAAARLPGRVDRVVLMAPAVMFAKPGHHLLPPERINTWRGNGALPFFHYGYNEERPLNYAFYEDTLQYDAFDAVFSQPTLIFQGLRDSSVDARTVEQFSRNRPNVTLSLLDDDHQLIASLPRMWNDVEAFLGLVE
jgi:hypothetical protein